MCLLLDVKQVNKFLIKKMIQAGYVPWSPDFALSTKLTRHNHIN